MPGANPRGRFLTHEWPDGCAVFDLVTGDTHILDVVAGLLFRVALDGRSAPDGMRELREAVRAQLPGLSPPEIEARLREARERLRQAGLLDAGKS